MTPAHRVTSRCATFAGAVRTPLTAIASIGVDVALDLAELAGIASVHRGDDAVVSRHLVVIPRA